MKAFFFSFSPSLLLIFCKASALRGVALSEARLHGRRGAQRLHQGTAPAGSGRPGPPTVGRGRSHQAELASPGGGAFPEPVWSVERAGCWDRGTRTGRRGGLLAQDLPKSWPGERGIWL